MATKYTSTSTEFNKKSVIDGLEKVRDRVVSELDSYEDSLELWRKQAPNRFMKFVEEYNPDGYSHRIPTECEPPVRKQVCTDYNVQRLNRAIARIRVMDGDTIRLRLDDDVFNWLGTEECI